jgi:hypothetical protein
MVGARKMLLGKMKSEKFWVRRNWFLKIGVVISKEQV